MRFILMILIFAFATNSSAAPSDMPSRKSGLWEVKMQMPEMPQAMAS